MHPFSGIRRVLRLGARSAELNEELTFHFERTVEELIAKGLSPRQAEEEARRRFGNEADWRGEIDRIDRSVAMRRGWMERLRTGGAMARYAARRIRRSPGLALGVVLTFGLGIGANATMFSIVDRLLLSPPPHIENPDEVRRLLVELEGREGNPTPVQSYPTFRDLSAAKSFSDVAAYAGRPVIIGKGEDARPLSGIVATSNFFTLLGVRPELGRFYTPEEDRKDGAGVAVISHDLWQSMFGGSADVLDESIDFGYGPYAIIGVTPAGFTGVDLHRVDLWLPFHTTNSAMRDASWEENRHWFLLGMIGRLAPGVTESAASDEASALLVQGERAAGIDSNRVREVTAPLLAARGPNAPP